MSDVGPWTRFNDQPQIEGGALPSTSPAVQAGSGGEQGPWLKYQEAKPGRDAGLYASFLSGFTSDDKETVRMLADRLFPNESLDKSVQRFSKDKSGEYVYKSDDGNTYRAMPSGGLRGMAGDVLKGAGPSLPIGGGAAAGMATLPLATTGVGLAGTMAAATGGAMAGEAGRQKLGDYLLGRASTDNLNVLEIARQGGESGLGQGIGVGIGSLLTRGAVRDISKFNPAKTTAAYQEAERVGVPITPAEATGLPTLAAQQKRLTNITATSDEMRDFLKVRDQKVIEAWNGLMNRMSGAADAEDVGRLVRDTASGVLKDMRTALSREAKPYYDAAYTAKIPFTKEMEDFTKRPTMQEGLSRAFRMMEDEGVDSAVNVIRNDPKTGRFVAVAAPDQRTWDYIKRGLDDFINSSAARNEATGGLNNQGRIAVQQKNMLLDFFDNPKSPAYNPAYKEARTIYSEGAEDVTGAMQSALNILAKTKDTNILQAAQHIFNPNTRSPKMVAALRTAIEGKDPDAWQAIKRLHINDVTESALRITETGDVANPAGKIFKAFSQPSVQANLNVAMTQQERADFKELLNVFRRAASVPALRSDTEFNRLASEEAATLAKPVSAKIVSGVQALNPANRNFLGLQSVQEYLTNRNLERNATEVVKLITSGDPDAIQQMRELRRLSMSSRVGLVAFGHLLERGSLAAAENAVIGKNQEPANQ